jgi:hypothetical protein
VTNEVDAFVREVRNYCNFVENAAEITLEKRLASARRRLLALYEAALDLPASTGGDDGVELPSVAPPETWPGFEEKEHYWEIFDPYIDAPAVGGSLGDDVLDVYTDVRDGLAYWDAGRHANAIWSWRFLMDCHWGDHAVDALRALHRACKGADR